MKMFKKLAAVLLAIVMLIPGLAVCAESISNNLQWAAEQGFENAVLTDDASGSVTIAEDLEVDFGGFVYTGTEGVPVITVEDGVTVTLNNGVVVAAGGITVPAIVLGEGATLIVKDTVITGATAKNVALLSTAIVMGEDSKVVLENSAVVGGYGIDNSAEGAQVIVDDSVILGSVAAVSNTSGVVGAEGDKMVDVGTYVKDRLDAGTKANKLIDYVLTGKAIISVTALSSVAEYTISEDSTTISVTAEEIPSKYAIVLDYTWVPSAVVVGSESYALVKNTATGKYEATVPTTVEELDAGVQLNVEFKLYVALSDYVLAAMNKVPGLVDKVFTAIENAELMEKVYAKVDATVRPYIATYTELYASMESQITGVESVLADNEAKLAEAGAALADAQGKLAEAYTKIEQAIQDAWETFDEEVAKAWEEFYRLVDEKKAEAEVEIEQELQNTIASKRAELMAELERRVLDKVEEVKANEIAELRAQYDALFAAWCLANGLSESDPTAVAYRTLLDTQMQQEIADIETEYAAEIELKKQEVMQDVMNQLQSEIDTKIAEARQEALDKLNQKFDEIVAEKTQELNDKIAEERAKAEDQIATERAKYTALIRNLETKVAKAEKAYSTLRDQFDALRADYYTLIAAYNEIGESIDALVALYDTLNADSNFSRWIVTNLPVMAELLDDISAQVDGVVDSLNNIKYGTIPAITDTVDELIAIVEDIQADLNSADYQEMMDRAGVTFTLDVSGFSYDLSGVTSTLDSAISAVEGLQAQLDEIRDTLEDVLANEKYILGAEIVENYDPETLAKDALAKLLAKGPEALAKLIADEQYFGAKYSAAMEYVEAALNKIVAKYPELKEKAFALADRLLTAENAAQFRAAAEDSLSAAMARFPAVVEGFFDAIDAGVAKYPEAKDEIAALADKLVANTDKAVELLNKVVLGYVNPFLHGEFVATVTGEATLTAQKDAPQETETNAPGVDSGDATISLISAIVVAASAVALGTVYTVDKKRKH